MEHREENYGRPGDDNQRIGRDLYRQDQQKHHTSRYGYRGPQGKKWDEGNFFHTGPNPRGAQDRDHQQGSGQNRGAGAHRTGEGAHPNDHYGSRSDSPYRNESRYLNHGSRGQDYAGRQPYQRSSQPGNYNEPPTSQDSLRREGLDDRSRYKESDYRYGSGSHNWYTEGRYSRHVGPEIDENDKRGFFERVRDTWNDIMHADDPDYRPHYESVRRAEQLSSRHRYGSEELRGRHFNRGYEGGPRWADETGSGRDNYYDDEDRNQRYRR